MARDLLVHALVRRGIALVALVLVACAPERALAPIEPCTRWSEYEYVSVVETASAADILVVLDGTPSTRAATRTLAEAMPAFLDGLAAGDFDHDGRIEATPVSSIRVGVVTSDRGLPSDCSGEPATQFVGGVGADADGVFSLDGASTAAVADAITSATSGGCPVTQPLAAALDGAALFPWMEDGIVRPEGVLIVIVVTDRDDCSLDGPGPSSGSELRTRCAGSDGVELGEYFASRLQALRTDPEMVALAVVGDLPLRSMADASPYFTASCPSGAFDSSERLRAAGDMLRQTGSTFASSSICDEDTATVLDAMSGAIAGCVDGPGVCTRQSRATADGTVSCELEVSLPPLGSGARYTHCVDLGAPYEWIATEPFDDGTSSGEREVCRLAQLTPTRVLESNDPGWFYDDGTFGAQSRLPSDCSATYTLRGTRVAVGSRLWLRCSAGLDRATEEEWTCDPATGATLPTGQCSDLHVGTATLACDPVDAACGVPCVTDSDCHAAGLPAHVCDARRLVDLLGPGRTPPGASADAPHGFCVDPTCS